MATDVLNSTDKAVDIDWVFIHGDPRVKTYPLMETPYASCACVLMFLLFIKVIGPMIMKHRRPYSLRSAMFFYNIALTILSGWMFYRFTAYGWFHKYSWRCESIDYSNNEAAVKILEAYYIYHLSKYIEFFDTIFFVLRKKDSQVTFLHVFHHSYIPIWTWYLVKYGAGGYATITPVTNTFTHVMMYSYYLLSSLGPSVQKYLWWKRYITNIQMIQFILIMLESAEVMLFPPEHCNVRYFTAGLNFLTGFIFFFLFIPFYIDQYIRKKGTKSSKRE